MMSIDFRRFSVIDRIFKTLDGFLCRLGRQLQRGEAAAARYRREAHPRTAAARASDEIPSANALGRFTRCAARRPLFS